MAVTVRDINSLVYRYYVPRVEDNIFDATVLLDTLKKGAKTRRYPRQIVRVPLETSKGSSGTYSDFSVIPRSRKEVTSYAEYDFGNYYSEMTISQIDKLKTGTKNDVVNVLKVKQKNAEKTLADDINNGILSGSGSDNEMTGIETAIHTTGGSVNFGGKGSSDIAKWDNQYKDLGTAAPTWKNIVDLKTDCTQDKEGPDFWLGDKYVKAYIWSTLLSPRERYTNGELNAAGKLEQVAGLPWISDKLLESGGGTAGKAYLVNKDHMWLAIEKDNNFKFWPYQKPVNQFSYSAFYTVSISLAMDKRDVHGVMFGISL